MESQRSSVFLRDFLRDPKNQEAFGKFVVKYQPRLKTACLRRGLQDADAEDLTAGILLRFFERDVFDGFVFQTKDKFRAWLDTVARNAVLTFRRDRGRKPDAWSLGDPDAQEALHKEVAATADDLVAACEEARARVAAARDRVERRVERNTWRAFCLVDQEQSVDRVSEQLRMPKTSVWQALSRVRRKLREELANLHDPAGEGK